MNIAVIIVTYNAENYIDKCLQSVIQSNIPVKIFVFDNHSTDATIFIINKFINNNLVVIKNNKNIGFGAANNICMRKAYDEGFDFFFLINQDVYIQKNTISVLLQYLTTSAHICIISPLQMNGTGNRFDNNFIHYILKTEESNFVDDIYFNRIKDCYFVPFVNAACWLLPRKTIEKIGGFDPLFFHYGEDENYCNRVLFHQLKIAITTSTYIQHDRDDRNGKIRPEYDRTKNERIWLLKMSDVFHDREIEQQKSFEKDLIKIIFFHIAGLKFSTLGTAIKNIRIKQNSLKNIIIHKNKNKTIGMHWL